MVNLVMLCFQLSACYLVARDYLCSLLKNMVSMSMSKVYCLSLNFDGNVMFEDPVIQPRK